MELKVLVRETVRSTVQEVYAVAQSWLEVYS